MTYMKPSTPYATVLEAATSLNNHTGSWRTEHPLYVHRLPPCNKACPAGENIQEWLGLVEQEKYEEAWREIVKNNPLPAIMGRVCYHPCETACNRETIDKVVGINSVERFLGDEALRLGWTFQAPTASSGKRVLIVGAGPAGLSAAYHLANLGHSVTIRDRQKEAGGMLRYGIPSYRLPRDILDAEIARIAALGVKLETGVDVPNVAGLLADKKFDAVFLAIGAQKAKAAPFPSEDGARVLDALDVLRDMESSNKPVLGTQVVVYGGGNTAMDVARTAVRLGAARVTVVYRRTREVMPAHSFEVEEAMQEGVHFTFLTTIKSVRGRVMTLERMELVDGKARPTGKTETMEADSVVLALGQDMDKGFLGDAASLSVNDGVLEVDGSMMTGQPGLFAGGDMVPSERTATIAIGHGKKAARNIDAWLRGERLETPPKHAVASSDRLNSWYYAPSERRERRMIDLAGRTTTFNEVLKGLSPEDALLEARRCLSCGNCFECDNCFGVCPDNAIRKIGLGHGFEIDLTYCKGCGLCAAECPCGCIDMQSEEI